MISLELQAIETYLQRFLKLQIFLILDIVSDRQNILC